MVDHKDVTLDDLADLPILDDGEEGDLTSWKTRKPKRKPETAVADKEWFLRRFAALRMSQREVERMMGYSVGALGHVFAGRTTLDVPTLKKLCLLLGEPMSVIAARAGY